MGKRPLAGFQKAGINVFWTARSPKPTIQELIEDLCNSKRQPMELTQSCKGQGDCHGKPSPARDKATAMGINT
jgi:hypothetical protein